MMFSKVKKWGAAASAGLTSMVVAGAAKAETGDDFGVSSVTSTIEGAEGHMYTVMGVILGAVALLVVFGLIKRAMGR